MSLPSGASAALRAKTPRFAHHAVAFSPFFEDRLAVASGANFGLVGNGRLHILQISPTGLNIVKWFDTQDCVYDVAWNESHENQVLAGCGNGALRLFDTTLQGLPVKAWHEHSAEVVSVDWNNIEKDIFTTGSWDHTVKVWNVNRATSLQTLSAHTSQIYTSQFSPRHPAILASCSSDGYLKIFDLRHTDPSRPTHTLRVSQDEVLSLDWNKYDDTCVATAGKDRSIKVWDLRRGTDEVMGPGTGVGSMSVPVNEVKGHQLAIRKIQWSPHHAQVIASCGYDMSCKSWDMRTSSLRRAYTAHREFCMGLAWALFDDGLLSTCAWDEEVHLFRA
ncbi:WD40-repeat-containing domain protein [Naematelia encephala]|uniref:Peroxin-7 n=1 Tax=Naematelia encephala TaxID=71784 RepID=A0A1Y2AV64_9TREE|nr:WD40-repeat-containing domain protein [Naematelia encephala]